MYANEIMTTNVKTCSRDTNLEEIARLMWDHDCGAIPIVNQQHEPIGIVTDRDIAMATMLNHTPLWELTADTLIQGQQLSTCEQEDSVENCLAKMEQKGVRRLLVVDGKGKLAGIMSMGDTVAFAAKRAGGRSKKQDHGVPVDNLVTMLQQVSGHHATREQPVARASQ